VWIDEWVQLKQSAFAVKAKRLQHRGPCIFCGNPAQTVEHCPPKIMFLRSDRPSGWEFDACAACNEGSKSSDQIFAFFAYSNILDMTEAQEKHFRKIAAGIRNNQPQVIDEILLNSSPINFAGLISPDISELSLISMGPCIQSHIDRIADKLALSAFRKFFGVCTPSDCLVWHRWATNYSAINGEIPEVPLPLGPPIHIEQGKKTSRGQFVVQAAGNRAGNAVFSLYSSATGRTNFYALFSCERTKISVP
jgi:hypothetical protein